MIRVIVTLALLASLGGSAASQEAAPKLKELVTVTADVVRIGDLVENAGAASSIGIFRAPDLGHTGTVEVARIAEALKSHEIERLDTSGLTEVVVTRLSRVIAAKDVEERITRALAGQHGFGDVRNMGVTFDREVRALHVEASASADLLIARMTVDPRTGRFDVSFEIPGSAVARRLPLRFTGTAVETIEAAILSRPVGRGDMIRESDVTIERRPKIEAAGEAIGADQVIGMSAKRALRSGQVVRASDVIKADVIARHEVVTIFYEVPGIRLTMRGKALEAGAVGELINVLNVQSNRTVQAAVHGPGQVVVTAATPRLAAAEAPLSDNRRRRAPVSVIMQSRFSRTISIIAGFALLPGCTALDRIATLGDQPALTAIENPTSQPGYKPVHMPMPTPQPASYSPNSLWRNGSRAFFKDQRAHQVGDILTVKVKITDKATLENETSRSRKNNEDSGIDNFFGKGKVPIMNSAVPTRIFTADSNASSDGKGAIERKEELLTNIAGVVTQLLPNGNLVVEGRQEIRVNFEIRELIVAGIVRPEDIESDNTIDSSKIAQARIAYGGRGQITDVQQPRYGQQALDIMLPF